VFRLNCDPISQLHCDILRQDLPLEEVRTCQAEARLNERTYENGQLIRIWTQVIVRVLAIVVVSLGIAWLLYQLKTLLLLLIISIFFCYLIAPAVRLFEEPIYIGGRELRLPRSIAIGIVYVLIGFVLYLGLRLVWPQLSGQGQELHRSWDEYIKSGSEAANSFVTGANTWMRRLRLPQQWREYLTDHLGDVARSAVPWLEGIVGSLVGYLPYLTWLIVVPILSFFFLRDAESFTNTALSLLPDEKLRKRAQWLLVDISKTMAAYIRAQITACLLVGSLATVGFYILDAPSFAVLGAVAGVCEFVPLAGPLLAALIAVGVSLTVSFKTAVWVALFLTVLRIIQDYMIYPRIVGHGIKMHPLLVIVAIFGGAEVAGLTGIFLSVPVVALFIVSYHHYMAYRGVQKLKVVVGAEAVAEEPEVHFTPESATPSA
jgi:predicted PurR-regulated permease PerM